MNSVVAVILARERRMVSRFVAAGATSRERARPLDQIGVRRGVILRRLRERAVVRQVGQDLFYVDQESWGAVRRTRRRAASVLVIIGLVIVFAVLWSRRAQAGPLAAALKGWTTSRVVQGFSPVATAQIDAIFSAWNKPTSPGCALGVFRDGEILYERGYGMADLENDVPITPATVFYVGSLSKQFTAAAAALAISQRVLSADDSIRKYLPELPDYADSITVRHLIHHTSGLRDYNTLLAIAGRRGDEAYDNPTVLRITARQKALNFAPGTEYLYSNTGYTLLATVVERAAKKSFSVFADEHIFKPLGMIETHFHTDAGRLVKRRANAYAVRPDGSIRLDTPSNERAGAGGVYTSIRELLHWDENFYTGKVGGKALIEELQTPGRLKNGNELTYAWGLQIGTYRGLRIVEHGGSLGGYRAHLIRFPAQHTSFAALCNLAISPGRLVRQAADIILADQLKEPRPTEATPAARASRSPSNSSLNVDAQTLSSYAGKYHSDEIDSTFTIAVVDDKLTLRRETDAEPFILQPLEADTFRGPAFTITFERASERSEASRRSGAGRRGPASAGARGLGTKSPDKDGGVTSLLVDAGRVRGIRFVKSR